MYNNPNYSIEFGQTVDKGLEREKAFPFIYNFIPGSDDVPQEDVAPEYNGRAGVYIPGSTTIRYPVPLDRDYNFYMHWIRYSLYEYDAQFYNYWRWWRNPFGWFLEMDPQTQVNQNARLREVLVSVYFEGSNARHLYGGTSTNRSINPNSKVPITPTCLQGYEYGMGQVDTPYFLPARGVVMFEFENTSSLDFWMHGCIFGYKVRV